MYPLSISIIIVPASRISSRKVTDFRYPKVHQTSRILPKFAGPKHTKMKTLYLATHNRHKKEEIQKLFASHPVLSENFRIESMDTLGFQGEIPETADTLEGNALQKARFIHQSFNVDCFADDTGLEVEAIGNRPGVFSARYANMPDSFEESGFVSPESLQMPDPTFDQNIDRLLFKLENKPRKARFRSVICLILNNQTYYFEGCVNGVILPGRHGSQGFGYDPVFQPEGFEKSFAELDMAEKNAISHRGKAVQALIAFLEKTGKEAWTGQTASITPTN